MKMKKYWIYIFPLLCLNSPLLAIDKEYFKDRERGYWWYEKFPAHKDANLLPPNKRAINSNSTALTPKQILEQQGKELENALAQAVLVPTEENLKSYIQLAQKLNEQAQRFSTAFKESIWINPELDYTLKKPVYTPAILAQNENDTLKQENELIKLAKEQALLFFFKGSCSHCHQFAPILKSLAERYKFSVIAVTLDGEALKEFPHPKRNFLIGHKLNLTVVPALYLVNPDSNRVVPVGFGYADWSTLIQKILVAAKKRRSHS